MLKELPLRDPEHGPLRPAARGPDGAARMSFLESRLKQVPTGFRKVLYVNWPLVVLVTAVAVDRHPDAVFHRGRRFRRLGTPADAGLCRLGMVLMFIVAMVPIWFWRNMAGVAYLVSFALLIFVEFKGSIGMGAQRWIELGPINLQPSEMMKFTLVMLLAVLLRLAGQQADLAALVGAGAGAADRGADDSGADAAEPWHLADADPGRRRR